MDLRLRNLERLNARAVPLPHGTEVVTRVDRIVGERCVPQGSVGRVTKVDGGELDVTIVGVVRRPLTALAGNLHPSQAPCPGVERSGGPRRVQCRSQTSIPMCYLSCCPIP
jgi:hypothetical protein